MTDILDIESPGIDMSEPYSEPATEIMEKEIEEDVQAHRAHSLLDRLVGEKDYVHARKVAWMMFFKWGIDLGITE